MRDPGGRNAKNASEIRTLAEKDSLPIHVLVLDVTNDASVERCQADPCEDPRGTFLKRRQCSGSRGRRSADYRDSCGREAAEIFRQPPGLRPQRDGHLNTKADKLGNKPSPFVSNSSQYL